MLYENMPTVFLEEELISLRNYASKGGKNAYFYEQAVRQIEYILQKRELEFKQIVEESKKSIRYSSLL